MNKENIELAEEHIKLAEDLVAGEGRDLDENSEEGKLFAKIGFELERAETELEELEGKKKE